MRERPSAPEAKGSALADLLRQAGMPEYSCSRGARIFEEGSLGEEAFFILDGVVHIQRSEPGGAQRRVAVLEAGELFGEAAFLDRTPRLGSAHAATNCLLLVITRRDLPVILHRFPGVALELVRLFTHRIRVAIAREKQAVKAMELSGRIIAGLESGYERLAKELGEGPRRMLTTWQRSTVLAQDRIHRSETHAAAELERLEEAGTALLDGLRVQTTVHTHGDLTEAGMRSLMRRRLIRVQTDNNLRVRLHWPDHEGEGLEPAAARVLFDLVDASVSHAHGLAGARTVEIDILKTKEVVEIRIKHDGERYDPEQLETGKHPEAASDLEALRDRALLSGGSLETNKCASGGAKFSFLIPRALPGAVA